MKVETLIERVRKSHAPLSLSEFEKIARHFGFELDHVTGSHHVFRNWTGRKYVVPVHHKKVKAVYLRNFLKEQE